jgi:hypothetical protein
MFGEFCLMRGVDEGCLISLSEAPGDACCINLSVDHEVLSITCPLETLSSIEVGETAHLAGPDGLCGIERDRNSVRFRFISVDRRARSYEIEATRFDVALTMLAAGRRSRSFASIN